MKRSAIKITIFYLVFGSLWILVTNNIEVPHYIDFKTFLNYKGLFFIFFTSLVLYILLSRAEMMNKRIVKNLRESVHLKTFAEQSLREERNILRAIIDNIPDFIYVKDANNNQILSNKALWELLGSTSEEQTLGRNVDQFLRPDMAQSFEDEDKKIMDNKVAFVNNQRTFYHKDGGSQLLLVTRVPILDDRGNCTGLVGISKDITEIQRKFNRDQLVQKVIHNFSSFENLDDGLQSAIEIIANVFRFEIAEAWMADDTLETISLKAKWSERAENYFTERRTKMPFGDGIMGLTCKIGETKVWRDIQNNPNLLEKDFAKQQNLNDAVLIPIKYQGAINAMLVFLTTSFKDDENEVFDLLQEISGQLGFHIDKKKSELKLKEFNDQINAILENINDGFTSFDEHWKITYWNKAAETIFSIPREKMVGQNLLEIVSEQDDYRFLKVYRQVFKSQKAAHFEQPIPSRGLYLAISVYPTKEGLSVFFKDITEVKTLDAERRKRMNELNSKNAELEHFAYIASHDLQEPLRMVTSFLTQIERKYNDLLDDKGRQYIHFAVDGAVRMRKIILDLLEYSRAGKEAFEDEMTDVSDIINSIINLNSTLFEENNVQLTSDELPVIIAKKPMIRQLFQNIIINAIRYSRAGIPSEIHISYKEFQDNHQFSIKDNGIGIAEEYFNKIFILFQRLHSERNIGGTGLGLAISKKIVEAHEGQIWVESEVDKGTTFYFTIKK